MAASQVECLEEDNVNLKLCQSSPRFVYCERQRHALEALMAGGAGAFRERVRLLNIRPFLSEEEVRWVQARAEDYRPGEAAEEGEEEELDPELGEDLSLTYWPVKSDVRAPCLALGWPETGMWKGITRATVYTHPPMEEQPTIKEVVRRLLQNAKQVIAVVMDTFTDADIFLDLVEAAGGRRVPAYVLLSQRRLPQFIGMAEKVGTNLRLMDNIRVRALVGCSFCSRDGKKVTGDVKERFLLVDSETVVTGSYSFTWTDSRLERNLVTLLSGQVVDAFDREFRTLYAASKPLRTSDFTPPPPPAEGAKLGGGLPNGLSSPLRFATAGALEPASCFGRPPERPPVPSKSVNLHRVAARLTVAPAAQSSGGGAGDEAPPPAGPGDARSSFKMAVSAWQRQRSAGRGGAELAPALSDILRSARRAKMAGTGARAPAPKASKSMWDLSQMSQVSGSGPSLGGSSGLDHLELGEDAKSRLMKTQVTPAATLMRHRGAHKDEEAPVKAREPKSFYPSRPAAFATFLLSSQLRRASQMPLSPRPWAVTSKPQSAEPLDQ